MRVGKVKGGRLAEVGLPDRILNRGGVGAIWTECGNVVDQVLVLAAPCAGAQP